MTVFGSTAVFGLLLASVFAENGALRSPSMRERQLQGVLPLSGGGHVTTLQLVNAATNQVVLDLEDGMVVALNAI